MPELLLELFSEEIPARMQARPADDLKRLVTDRLKEAGLDFSHAEAHVTPRRLALVVDGLPERQPDVREERKGPRIDAPERAIQGFLGSVGVSLEQCEQREIKGNTFYFVVFERKGGRTGDVLPALIEDAVRALAWPKSMRFADQSFRWVRPLHSVIGVFDGANLAGGIDLGNGQSLAYGNTTRGHRFLAPGPITVTGFADYKAKLADAHVILDREERKRMIREGAAKLADKAGVEISPDDALLDEVAGLVEFPVPLLGTIDADFMDLPPEVMTSTMRANQKYFATRTADGAFADRFAVVANIPAADGGAAIVAGNERVLRARLADAKFFWDQDRKVPLGDRVPALSNIVFHAELGTVDAKVDRMQALAVDLVPYVPHTDVDRVRSAARLAKADLVTGMVGEFPELQGIMGRYYAVHDGEHADVAQAIEEHYAPLGPSDTCPTAPTSVAVALADKIDTLVGFFAIDEKPTGSKDPYALRRAALGVIRLIVENKLRVPLLGVFDKSLSLHGQRSAEPGPEHSTVAIDLLSFFADRLKVALREQGVRHDLIAAVFAQGGEDDLVRALDRVHALDAFLGSDDGSNLLAAYKRASNIVRIESKKDKAAYDQTPDQSALAETAEIKLFEALSAARDTATSALGDEDFASAMAALAALRAPVDTFFDDVTVNTDDQVLRANRLRMLSQIGGTLGAVADFSLIEG